MLGGYYRFYLGDYLRDTSGLSLMEHGAYNLLLHHYHSSEGCVSDEKPRLYRLCGAVVQEEPAAVDYVLKTYFQSMNGKLTNKDRQAQIYRLTGAQIVDRMRGNAMLRVAPRCRTNKTR